MTGPQFQPLSEIRIVDLSLALPGPYATFLLSELGARVTRVVPPSGDPALDYLPILRWINAGKLIRELDLKRDHDRAELLDMVAHADVFVEGFRPGVADRLGIDHRSLAAVNSGLVYCSLSGFGQTGPYRQVPGHDINYQSLAGVPHLTSVFGEPVVGARPEASLADLAMSTFTVIAVLAALQERTRSGDGSYVDLAAADATVSLLGPYIASLAAGSPIARPVPHYGTFQARDGKWLSLGGLFEQQFWVNEVAAFHLPAHWAHYALDERQREAAIIRSAIAKQIRLRDRDDWVRELIKLNVPAMTVLDPVEVIGGSYFRDRGVVGERDGDAYVGLPFRLEPIDAPVEPPTRPPRTRIEDETATTRSGM